MTLITTGAKFSPDRKYRYSLWRHWNKQEPTVNFIMLNPSTADENINDPTVERCQRRAAQWGYGGMVVTNLFAIRSTSPKILRRDPEPVGPENDRIILACAESSALVVCAWGTHGCWDDRDKKVTQMLRQIGIKLQIIRLTFSGVPEHPLYLPYELKPRLWEAR